ncbi:MAG: hypothetical protein JKX85_00620 [Phycisphaeraceae bacterium]|nr:hypothetical protein [Phycisphaeraceae bacterium]
MPDHSLNAYTFTFNHIRRPDDYLQFDDIGFDPLQMMHDQIKEISGQLINMSRYQIEGAKKKDGRSVKFQKIEIDRNRGTLAGWIEYGESGLESEIYRQNDGIKSHTKKINEAELIKHYFCFYCAPEAKKGLAVFHRYGVKNPKPAIQTILKRNFHENDVILKMDSASDARVFLEYLNLGTGKALTVKRYKQQRDSWGASKAKLGGCDLKPGSEIQVMYKFNEGFNLPFKKMLRQKASGQLQASNKIELIEIDGIGQFEESKITLEHNGKSKTFSVSKLGDAGFGWDLENHVEFEKSTNHPKWESINTYAFECIQEMIPTIV